MSHFPVAQLVCKDSLNLLLGALLNKSIVQNNLFLPWQTGEVSIRVSRALGTINDLKLAERELETCGKRFDAVLERARLKRSELVEDRNNDDRVDCDCEQLHAQCEGPEVEEELIASLLDDLEEGCAERNAECEGKTLRLQHVANPEGDGLLVEAEGLFEDKVVVVAEGQGQESFRERVRETKEKTLRDLALEARGEVAVHPEASDGPEFRVDVVANGDKVLDLVPDVRDEGVF